MELLISGIAAVSFLTIFVAFTQGRRVARPQQAQPADERTRLRGAGPLTAPVESLSAWLRGQGAQDTTWRGGLNARYLRLLKQADWYWGPGEPAAPDAKAPFWNLETMWGKKLLHGVTFALGGLVVAGVVGMMLHYPALTLVGLLAGIIGFLDPDSEVAGAAEKRRRQIILEMGYKVPELRVAVRSGKTFQAALRYLTARPGGPFVKELHRALAIYDITADLGRGLAAVIERNGLCEPLVALCGDLMAVLTEGGEVGVALEAHADTAQHEQRRLLRQQGQDNTQQMTYLVSGVTLLVIFALVGGPALWTVVTNMGGL